MIIKLLNNRFDVRYIMLEQLFSVNSSPQFMKQLVVQLQNFAMTLKIVSVPNAGNLKMMYKILLYLAYSAVASHSYNIYILKITSLCQYEI